MNAQPLNLFCSVEIGKIVIEGAIEILGRGLSHSILAGGHLADLTGDSRNDAVIPLNLLNHFESDLIARLGEAGGQGMALRIGRASFRYGLRRYGGSTGLSSLEFRLLPTPRRIKVGLEQMADILNGSSGQVIQVEDEPGSWIWRQPAAEEPGFNRKYQPRCYLMFGALQGFLSWASGGRYYPIEVEAQQVERAFYQVFRIAQKPLD